MKKKAIFRLIPFLFIVVIYLVYSRPKTVSQLYPVFTLDKCTGIEGYYHDGTQIDLTKFTIEHGSEEYEKMCAMFYENKYRRKITDILPRDARSHRYEPGDFQWEVYFCFKDIEMPDGSLGSGPMLQFKSWYGDLDIFSVGEYYSCYTDQQKEWEKEVLDLIKLTQQRESFR